MEMTTKEYTRLKYMIKKNYNPKTYGEDEFLITLIRELKYKPCVRVYGDDITLLYDNKSGLKRLVIELFPPYLALWEAKKMKDEEGNAIYIPDEKRTYLLDRKFLDETIEKLLNG